LKVNSCSSGGGSFRLAPALRACVYVNCCWWSDSRYLLVLDAVNDRVHTTVEKHHDDGEVVESAREVAVRVVQVVHQV